MRTSLKARALGLWLRGRAIVRTGLLCVLPLHRAGAVHGPLARAGALCHRRRHVVVLACDPVPGQPRCGHGPCLPGRAPAALGLTWARARTSRGGGGGGRAARFRWRGPSRTRTGSSTRIGRRCRCCMRGTRDTGGGQQTHRGETACCCGARRRSRVAPPQVMTSQDYGHGSWFWTVFSGSLNYQVVHHLFPGVNQFYYPKIAPNILRTCAEYGNKYNAKVRVAARTHSPPALPADDRPCIGPVCCRSPRPTSLRRSDRMCGTFTTWAASRAPRPSRPRRRRVRRARPEPWSEGETSLGAVVCAVAERIRAFTSISTSLHTPSPFLSRVLAGG